MSCLVVTSGRAKGHTFQVSPERDNVIGRMGGCEICIIEPRISRKHCIISAGQTGYTIRDLDSANGVFLNGKKIKEAGLQDGDKLRVGLTEMEFHLTERFEDAETKRLVANDDKAPDLKRPKKLKASGEETQPMVEFCSRCSGSITPAQLASGRAKRIDGKPVCVECVAKDQAAADAKAAAKSIAGSDKEDGKQATSAEEVSRLAEEIAEKAEDARPIPFRDTDVTEDEGEADDAPDEAGAEEEEEDDLPEADDEDVPVRAEDEFKTDALLIGDGAFDEPDKADGEPEEKAAPDEPREVADEPEEAVDESEEPADEPEELADEPEEADDQPREVADEPEEATDEAQEVADGPAEAADEPQEVADGPEEVTDEPAKAEKVEKADRPTPPKAKLVSPEDGKTQAPKARLVSPSAKTVLRDPGTETATPRPGKVTSLANDVAGAANRLGDEAPFPQAPLEAEEVIELEDEDDLPRVPDEGDSGEGQGGGGGGFDEDAKTPRPGSQIRVL